MRRRRGGPIRATPSLRLGDKLSLFFENRKSQPHQFADRRRLTPETARETILIQATVQFGIHLDQFLMGHRPWPFHNATPVSPQNQCYPMHSYQLASGPPSI